ncbi:DUF3872 domain-containing protein [Flavobacterium notoginsengisoli]|uniref:DUF3872 domain-containing protein n=1 Tax=Flavobacterium notoginsengisoli TaxID=1478199 RepID=UPI00362B073B
MKAILSKFTKGLLPAMLAVFISSIILLSCGKDELEIQKNFPFEVKIMPVAKDIANGGTAEIRISIEREGSYSGALYFIRYFQYDGQGTLQYYDAPKYLPNDLYALPAEEFRLYYTSNSVVSQSFDVWISDNFGNEKKLSFEFNSAD